MNLDILLDQYAALDHHISMLTSQKDALKAAITEQLPKQGYIANGVKAAWARGRVNNKAIEKNYPAATHPELYKQTLDTTAVKKHIPEVELDEYRSEPSVRITFQ